MRTTKESSEWSFNYTVTGVKRRAIGDAIRALRCSLCCCHCRGRMEREKIIGSTSWWRKQFIKKNREAGHEFLSFPALRWGFAFPGEARLTNHCTTGGGPVVAGDSLEWRANETYARAVVFSFRGITEVVDCVETLRTRGQICVFRNKNSWFRCIFYLFFWLWLQFLCSNSDDNIMTLNGSSRP